MKPVFIYALNCPVTGRTRYIGKTTNPATRLTSHLSDAKKRKPTLKRSWIKNLAKQGLQPLFEIIDEVSFEHWPQLEVAYIEFFLEQGCELTNGTLGGEDPPSMLGKKHSPEARAKISQRNRGRKHSLEEREKQSARCKGIKRSPEACAAVSAGLVGRKVSEETRAKLRISCRGHIPWSKGKTFSPEYRAKISAAKSGEKHPLRKKKKLWQTNLLSLLLARNQQLK